MIVEVQREAEVNGAIPSVIYIDGARFAYGLENSEYMIPAGNYTAYGQLSPSFGANKLYINVSGRSGIMFHGGNTKKDTKGCILTAYARTSADTIQSDASADLFDRVNAAYMAGEPVNVVITNKISFPWWLVLAAAAGIYYGLKTK